MLGAKLPTLLTVLLIYKNVGGKEGQGLSMVLNSKYVYLFATPSDEL